MSQKTELKQRVQAKQKRLEARINELRADVRHGAREEANKLEQQLQQVKESVADGFDKLSEEAARKLNKWLKDDSEQ